MSHAAIRHHAQAAPADRVFFCQSRQFLPSSKGFADAFTLEESIASPVELDVHTCFSCKSSLVL
jgi:hypothetical protein